MLRNREIANLLDEIAELLEAKGESVFRIGAYRNAARRIEGWPEDIEEVWKAGRLDDIPGVGESIAAKVSEYLQTGRLEYLQKLKEDVGPGLAELLAVPGLGPRRAHLIHDRLGISTVDDLAAAAREHRLRALPRMSEKLEAAVLREVTRLAQRSQRLPLGVALPAAEEAAMALRSHPAIQRVEPAGSIRRRRDTIGDIDLLVASAQPAAAVGAFTSLHIAREVLASGSTKATILTAGNLQIDLRVVAPDEWGAALLYFTGSKEHNIELREMAMRRGWKLNEYGLFDEASGRRLASATEHDVYASLGLPWIPPELRESRGEIAAAAAGRLPTLIEVTDLRGDLHVHSNWSDGADTLEAIAAAAKERGYEYLAITDHSPGLGIARGLTRDRVKSQRVAIEALNARLAPFRLLHGAEVNIRNDGTLDYPETVLNAFDIVVIAVHGAFTQSEAAMTERILAAMRKPSVAILAHPTGRLIGKREPYAVDLERVLRGARECNVAVEINSQGDRLDLNDQWARRAKELGVALVVSTDAHAVGQLDLTRYGVAMARRAWLESNDILNTLPLDALLERLRSHREAA
ncbi:MAG TPA: DNA polymerase/3'-5' exonuclease PolX [Chloroflexota bacterium]|nr:DNA polymerase/3'-5' exonuclease PolX [Chloroflexota bacterium]